jgi:TrmH family RNA methyltransferase
LPSRALRNGSTLIQSPHNDVIQRLRRLARRPEPGKVLLEGPRVIREAAACGVPLELLAVRQGVELDVAADRVVTLGERALASLSQTITPQGALAIARREEVPLAAALARARSAGWPLVVLDGVQDPGNVGAICRTAAAAGAPAVAVLEGSADPHGPKAVRASAGLVLRLAVARGRWSDLSGLHGWGASATGGVPLDRADVAGAELLAFGSEAHGLRRDDLELVTILMAPGAESLNVGAAAAVILFEVRRRLTTATPSERNGPPAGSR